MRSFSDAEIEGLIAKARQLELSHLRVADGDLELSLDLPRSARIPSPKSVATPTAKSDLAVASQFVGYFRPSVEIGAGVVKDMVVGVVESLGLPNDVISPGNGRLVAFSVSDGDAVEYGTIVARIET
jgi:biotin carboxyl carrier protein